MDTENLRPLPTDSEQLRPEDFLLKNQPEEPQPHMRQRYWLHALLFLVTLVTTTLSGLEWMSPALAESIAKADLTWDQFSQGFAFSLPFLGILTVHEFGHYFFARRYGAKVSLPFYIPIWLGWLGSLSIGTLGAFIRINSPFKTRRQLFDVGAAGPLAGYVATLLVLVYGYTHLPPADYIYTIHPEYIEFGKEYAKYVYQLPNVLSIQLGSNLTTMVLSQWLADPALLPNPYEMMHYPFLFAGFMALFFTALNLFPIGQLDGGHILYGLVGPVWHRRLSPLLFIALVAYSGLGVAQPILSLTDPDTAGKLQWDAFYLVFLYITFSRTVEGWKNTAMLTASIFGLHYVLAVFAPDLQGYNGWLVFCFVLGRFLGIYHPPTLIDEPLSPMQKWVGIISILVFLMSFSPQPFIFD
jgi:Zn-dependent protease